MNANSRHLSTETARLLTLSTEPWLSCEDCFELMDVYVETLMSDPDTTDLPEMRVHLRGCAACAEEAESLLLLVAEQDGLDAGPAARRLQQPPA